MINETNNGAYPAISISYNSIGNITSKTIGSNTFTYAPDSVHKHAVDYIVYNSQTYQYSYDANGNMTYGPDFTNLASIKTRTVSYNADNMPTQIIHSSGVTTKFRYDGMGTRFKKSADTIDTYYIGDHFEIYSGIFIKYIFAGSLRVAQVKGSTRSYFHKDHLGSSTVMTNASGLEVESTDYMPFGGIRNHTGTTTSNYKFTDQELDSSTGLYNYDARLYDPVIGRFISADTVVPKWNDPQSFNRYSYCLNNPLIYHDPSGHNSLVWFSNDIYQSNKNNEGYNTYKGYIYKDSWYASSKAKQKIDSVLGTRMFSSGILEITRNASGGDNYNSDGSMPPTKDGETYEVRIGTGSYGKDSQGNEIYGDKFRIGEADKFTSETDKGAIGVSAQVENPVDKANPRRYLNFDPYNKPKDLDGCAGISKSNGNAYTGTKKERFEALNADLKAKIPDLNYVNSANPQERQKVEVIVDDLFK